MTRYELIERIGAGGMAEIFRGKAIAAGGFEKPVAIKRILPHLSQDRRFVELLIAEANILSHLRHRNIVQIFDVGLGDDGQYFLVMEYVDGSDLGALVQRLDVRRKRLPVELVLHIGAEVCEALEHAHAARGPDQRSLRIVHRDVSPSNVLLSRSGEVKLTDFGIAKRPEEVTGHGGVRGKFAYISPEQAMNTHVDARSDVYSLGIVLYELVLGHRLFSHLADFDALRAVRSGVVRPPREIDPALAPELEEILMKTLAHDPAQRFASAGELGAKLRGLRYAMESSGDPAKEIGRILIAAMEAAGKEGAERDSAARLSHDRVSLERAAKAREAREEARDQARRDGDFRTDIVEPTVVRIRTAAGFTSTGTDALATDTASFVKAKLLLEFEEEKTLAVSGIPEGGFDEQSGSRPLGKRRPWAQDTADVPTQLVEARALGPRTAPRATSPPLPAPPETKELPVPPAAMARQRAAAGPPADRVVPTRAATPTARDLFHRGELLDRKAPTLRAPVSRARTRWLLLGVTAAAVAVLSFLIARMVVSEVPVPTVTVLDSGAASPSVGDGGAAIDSDRRDAGAAPTPGSGSTRPPGAAKKPAGGKGGKKPPAKKSPGATKTSGGKDGKPAAKPR